MADPLRNNLLSTCATMLNSVIDFNFSNFSVYIKIVRLYSLHSAQ